MKTILCEICGKDTNDEGEHGKDLNGVWRHFCHKCRDIYDVASCSGCENLFPIQMLTEDFYCKKCLKDSHENNSGALQQ